MELKVIFSLLFLISISFCTLQVIEAPQKIQNELIQYKNDIPYSIANYGHIPYGRRMIGNVTLANPIDACNPISPVQSNFVLIQRGGCSFVQKSRNAQRGGAHLAIIMDNIVEESEYITLGDDGTGATIEIPTVFVSEKVGQVLQEAVTSNMPILNINGTLTNQTLILSLTFNTKQTEKVEVKFFINIPNPEAYTMLREFDDLRREDDDIEDMMIFQPVYEFFSLGSNMSQNCLSTGNGKYCCLDPDGDASNKPANGKQMAEEQIRQLCIFNLTQSKSYDKWFDYIEHMQVKCPRYFDYSSCSKEAIKKLKIDQQLVDQCFAQALIPDYENNLPALDVQLNYRKNSGVNVWPGVTINNVTYRGSHNGTDVMEAVCAHMLNPTSECEDILEEYIPEYNGGISVTTIVIIVITILVVFFFFMVFVYRRMVRKELTKEMNAQVNQMVSQYIAFYESRKQGDNERQ